MIRNRYLTPMAVTEVNIQMKASTIRTGRAIHTPINLSTSYRSNNSAVVADLCASARQKLIALETKCDRRLIFLTSACLLLSALWPVWARDITVKYRDTPVDIDNGHFEQVHLKESSLVKSIYFDARGKYLLVNLRGTYYHYCGITASLVDSWRKSESLGAYYNEHIQGNYDCRANPVPSYD